MGQRGRGKVTPAQLSQQPGLLGSAPLPPLYRCAKVRCPLGFFFQDLKIISRIQPSLPSLLPLGFNLHPFLPGFSASVSLLSSPCSHPCPHIRSQRELVNP